MAVPLNTELIVTVAALQLPVEDCVISTTAAGLKDKTISSKFDKQGPAGSSVVNVNVTLPKTRSAALGV